MKKYFLPALLLSLMVFSAIQGQSVAQWRGIHRDGIYQEQNLLNSWPASGPTLLWFTEELGRGYGSPAVQDGRIYINGEIDSTSYLFVFEPGGKLVWKAPFGSEFTGRGFSSNFPGNRSTPTVAGDLVYVTSGTGTLACFETATGKPKWSVNMIRDLGGYINEFGYCESPLIDGDLVYCQPGGKKSNLAALNRFTGKPVWISPGNEDTISYCSPMLVTLPGRKLLIGFTIHSLFAVDADNGKLIWTHKQDTIIYGIHGNTPVFENGSLYYVDNDANGVVKLELLPDGTGYRESWRNREKTNDFSGFVIRNGKLYTTTETKKIISIDTQTGHVADSLRLSSAAIILADNQIYAYTDKGDICLLSLTGEKMMLAGKFRCDKGTKESFAHPVIADGVLYIRHGNTLLAYAIKKT